MQTTLAQSAIAPSASTSPPSFGVQAADHDVERERRLLEIARAFLAAIEEDTLRAADDTGSSALDYYASDVLQEEFPNQFVKAGAQRNLDELREAGKRGRKVMRAQRFEPRTAQAFRDLVILEVLWVGTLALDVGSLKAGDEMRAHFAVFLEFRGDQIVRHRTYDCFEPF
jgi:ketosteroid isomerase-like protein